MGIFRSLRHDKGIWPVPANGRPDAYLVTHTSARALGSPTIHKIIRTGDVAYVTICGETLFFTSALRCDAMPSECCRRTRKGPRSGLTDPEGP